jgi:hypothetical protein
MVKRVLVLGLTLLLASLIAWAGMQSWNGVVSDSHCGLKHSKASAQATACVEKCVAGGGKYVFVSDGKLYQIEPQDKFKGLGGKAVTVKGRIAGDTITAESVEPAAGQ